MKTFVCRPAMGAAITALVAVFLVPSAAHAQSVDPLGDFLSTYTGAKNGDLDVLTADVLFTGPNFVLTTTLAGNVGTTPGALYVWGFDRGAGTARFSPALANTENIKFDAAVTLRPDTTLTIARIGGTTTNLGAGSVIISGNRMTATIAASELPTTGLAPSQYTFNLWPRLGSGNNNQSSDFAPNSTNVPVIAAAAPEPGTLLLFAFAVPVPFAGFITRRRRCKAF